jgi:hypothetical protein
MVNENHFRFDRKSFFNFWKTIYGFKNRKSFFEIKLLVLAHMFHIRLPESSNGQSSESRRRRNSITFGHRHRMSADQISAKIGRNLAMVKNKPDLAGIQQFWPDPAKYAQQNPATATGRCRISTTVAFSPFVIFSCIPNARKYFRKNHFTSKQMEHKRVNHVIWQRGT